MLRPLYRCMLRMHPPSFRERFADEILSIFDTATTSREQFRLLVDAFVSLARQWIFRPEFWQGAPLRPAQLAPDGIPSFYSFDSFRPRTTAVIHGSVLTVTLFFATCYAIRYSWIHVLNVRIPEIQFERSEWLPSAGPSSNQSSGSPIEATRTSVASSSVSGPFLSKAQVPGTKAIGEVERTAPSYRKAHSKPGDSVSATPPPSSAAVISAVAHATLIPTNAALDPAHRHLVIEGAIRHLRHYYVDPVAARKMAAALRRHEQNGDDNDATDGTAFADLLTDQMRQVSNDRHLAVVYSQIATPEHQVGPTQEILVRYEREMARTNCTFEKVEVLPNNIGYVKFNSFPDLSICQSTATTAMTSLNETDAVIFDLRDNRGGLPAMVAFMESYLFEHPTHLDDLYDRANHSTLQSWTLSPVAGNKLADKPAYVLISHSTFSGAEEFSYDMKMLKRATLVGETTTGGAHMTRPRRIDGHFTIRVPDTTPINPISKTNWEGIGVTPDVNAKAADALAIAEKLAANKLQRK
jgi:hypothetical protein